MTNDIIFIRHTMKTKYFGIIIYQAGAAMSAWTDIIILFETIHEVAQTATVTRLEE